MTTKHPITLPRGTLKVILPDYAATVENDSRARANGRVFKPVYVVYVLTEADGECLSTHLAHAVTCKGAMAARTALSAFPYAALRHPDRCKYDRLWTETYAELTLTLERPADLGEFYG